MTLKHPGIAAFGAFLFALCVGSTAMAAPKSEPWPLWEAHDSSSVVQVDHDSWQDLLSAYLKQQESGPNLFDYAAVTEQDRAKLDGYLAALQGTQVSELNRNEQYAFWLNFYNALTIQVMLDHWPTDTILDVDLGGAFFSNGPWDKELVTVEGTELSLNDIEHRILRPIWQDPRVHYGVNCASIGCPNLNPRAFTSANVHSELDQAARIFINSPRGARVTESGELIASKIYDWFQEDFDGTEAGVIAHLKIYAESPLAEQLESFSDIDDFEYDWGVNAP